MRSKFEQRIAKKLDDLGVKYKYEEFSYPYEVPLRKNRIRCADCEGTNILQEAWYTPDFFLQNGTIIEAKGRWDAADRRKMLAIIDQFPEERFVMVFMRDNKIHKRSETKYSDFCEANGIEYAINDIKEEWYQQ